MENGARTEERHEAEADARQAAADLARAQADHARAVQLFDDQVISRAEMDKSEQALGVLSARFDAVRARRALVEADAREEDRARARAEVSLAQARLVEARALLDKTIVRSPIDASCCDGTREWAKRFDAVDRQLLPSPTDRRCGPHGRDETDAPRQGRAGDGDAWGGRHVVGTRRFPDNAGKSVASAGAVRTDGRRNGRL